MMHSPLDSAIGLDKNTIISSTNDQVTITGIPEGDSVDSVTGLPAGLTLDAATGVISGKVSYNDARNYDVTVTTANGETATLPLEVIWAQNADSFGQYIGANVLQEAQYPTDRTFVMDYTTPEGQAVSKTFSFNGTEWVDEDGKNGDLKTQPYSITVSNSAGETRTFKGFSGSRVTYKFALSRFVNS